MSDQNEINVINNNHNSIIAFATLAIVITLAILLDSLVTYWVLRNNSEKSSDFLLTELEVVLESNSRSEEAQMEEHKESYIKLAQATAYILSQNHKLVNSTDELIEIADLLSIDEINIFDESGTIFVGTNPEYYGMNVNDGEQIAFFKPMLADKTMAICQDITPNTAVEKNMMYAAAWDTEGTMLVQIGIEPKRLLAEFSEHEMANVIASMTVAEGYTVFAVDPDSKEIFGASETELVGANLHDLYGNKLDRISELNKGILIRQDGQTYYCNSRKMGEYLVVSVFDTKLSNIYFLMPIIIIFLYLFIAGLVILGLFARLQQANESSQDEIANNYRQIDGLEGKLEVSTNQNAEMNNIIRAMAELYYSVHLIDLKENTIVIYNDNGKIKELVDKTSHAAEMMRSVISATIIEEYKQDALEFTELTTLSERMKDKRMLSREFVGMNIGWFVGIFTTVEADEDGYPTKVVFATRWINDEKKREEHLVYITNTDELTGLSNRRAYEDTVKQYVQNGLEENLAYVSVDVNLLKEVNDSLGHVAGDELILGTCECMKHCFGQYGHLYRIGGDEIVAFLHLDDVDITQLVAKFENEVSIWRGSLVDSLSVAVGYSTKKELKDNSIHEMIVLADKRMSESKTMQARRSFI